MGNDKTIEYPVIWIQCASCTGCSVSSERVSPRKGTCKEFREFYLAVEDAEMECKLRNIGFIQDAAEEDWRAAMSWLERRYPEEYGGNKHELTHKFTAGAENTRLLLELLLKGTDEVRTKPKKRPQKVSR